MRRHSGFTVLELLVALSCVGILASIALPQISEYRERAQVAQTASELRGLATAFMAYATAHEDYPPDSHRELPPGMDAYVSPHLWQEETPLGGFYNWEGPDGYP